eukprot:1972292-Alexandrium_andersonii.AAC.1
MRHRIIRSQSMCSILPVRNPRSIWPRDPSYRGGPGQHMATHVCLRPMKGAALMRRLSIGRE